MKLHHVPIALALAATTLLASPAPTAIAASPVIAASPDYDRDGKTDLAFTMIDDMESTFIRIKYGSGSVTDIVADDLAAGPYGIGGALLARDLNRDGYTDLVTSTDDPSGVRVQIIPGSATGLQVASRHTFLALGKANSGVRSLALVESPVRRLAVSLSTYVETSKGSRYDDEVRLYQLSDTGEPTGSPVRLVPGSGKVPALVKGGSFGWSMDALGSQLFIGAPDAKVAGKAGAGAVLAVSLNSSGIKTVKTITQATKSVAGAVDKYDYFGRAVVARDGFLVVGTPGDTVGRIKRTGSIQVFTVSSKGIIKPVKRIAQDSAGIPGKAERYDRFGGHLAIGTACKGVPAVLVGGSGEVITKGHESDGSAWLIPLRKAKGCAAKQFYEGHGLPGKPADRGTGDVLAFVRVAGATADELVIGSGGSVSQGPLGQLYRISSTTGVATKLNPDGIFGNVAGR